MTPQRSDNETAIAGIILFAVGIATILSLQTLTFTTYSTSEFFLIGLVAGTLIATGLVLILRSSVRRTSTQ